MGFNINGWMSPENQGDLFSEVINQYRISKLWWTYAPDCLEIVSFSLEDTLLEPNMWRLIAVSHVQRHFDLFTGHIL